MARLNTSKLFPGVSSAKGIRPAMRGKKKSLKALADTAAELITKVRGVVGQSGWARLDVLWSVGYFVSNNSRCRPPHKLPVVKQKQLSDDLAHINLGLKPKPNVPLQGTRFEDCVKGDGNERRRNRRGICCK